jgi:hypothetical protein
MKVLHVLPFFLAGTLVLISADGAAAPAIQAPPAAKAPDPYPPVRNATVVCAFSLPDDAKADVIKKALAALSTKEADCGIRYGPMKAESRPSRVFVLVEAPANLPVKDVTEALKKGAKTVEPIAWTCFQSEDPKLGRGLGGGMPGMTPRDFLLGMSNDLRWVEAGGGVSEFFFTPGKMTADLIKDRFTKLAKPFGVKDVGAVLTDSIHWPLLEPVDAAAAKRAEKELGKLDGVKSIKIDAAAKTLDAVVTLESLTRGALPTALASDDSTLGGALAAERNPSPRMRFDTNAILDALEKEKISVAKVSKESAGPSGK